MNFLTPSRHSARSALLALLALLILGGPFASAQDAPLTPPPDDENLLLTMLGKVPGAYIVEINALVSYADYRAVEAARGLDTPTLADFDDGTALSGLWIATGRGLGAGMDMNYFFIWLTEGVPLVGFSPLDVDRAITFGQPPEQGQVLMGDFDPAAIDAAYEARGRLRAEIGGLPAWCSADGCDQGMTMNIGERNPGDPFGGQLGRAEPVAVAAGDDATFIYNSPSLEVVEGIASAAENVEFSLAGLRDYRATARALAAVGALRQAVFINPLSLAGDGNSARMGADADPFADLDPLPVPSLIALADTWDPGDDSADAAQIALIALVYTNAGDAAQALDVIEARLAVAESLVMRRPFADLLARREMAISAKHVYEDAEAERTVAVLEFRYPQVDNVERDEVPAFLASSLGFRLFNDALYQRDLGFLTP
jgi:hypothetical protein